LRARMTIGHFLYYYLNVYIAIAIKKNFNTFNKKNKKNIN